MRYFSPVKYTEILKKYSDKYHIDKNLIYAVIKTESDFKSDARSKKGAVGLMQITPETGTWLANKIGIKNYNDKMLLDPDTNINMGTWYITDLWNEFKNVNLVLAAYNGGRGNVTNWLKNTSFSKNGKDLDKIPFVETDRYVKTVLKYYNIYSSLYGR